MCSTGVDRGELYNAGLYNFRLDIRNDVVQNAGILVEAGRCQESLDFKVIRGGRNTVNRGEAPGIS